MNSLTNILNDQRVQFGLTVVLTGAVHDIYPLNTMQLFGVTLISLGVIKGLTALVDHCLQSVRNPESAIPVNRPEDPLESIKLMLLEDSGKEPFGRFTEEYNPFAPFPTLTRTAS